MDSADRATDPAVQRWCAWTGVGFLVFAFIGFMLAGLLPPPSPDRSATEVSDAWGSAIAVKKTGILLMLIGSMLLAPFGAGLATRVKQIEGGAGPLTYVIVAATGVNVVTIFFPTFMFAAAAYRPERPVEITQALDDLGWLPFVMNWPSLFLQALAVGVAVLRYESPTFPRWFGFFNLWAAVLFTGGGFAIFFRSGIYAWNGLLTFWITATVLGIWILVVVWQLLACCRDAVLDERVALHE